MNTKRKQDRSKRKLIEILELLDIKSFDSSLKLHLDIFKNPDKELFRKIMCLILVRIGGFDDWLTKYSKPIILSKTEAEFRSSFKDIIPLINERGNVAKANLKLVNQSMLVAPCGPIIVSFLLSLSEYALKVVFNEPFTPPKVEEADEKLEELKLNAFQINCMKSEFENKIEMLKDELSQIIFLEKGQEDSGSDMSELNELIKNNPYLYVRLKNNLSNLEAIDEAITEYKTEMESRLVENEKSVNELEDLNLCLSHLKSYFDEMECFRDSKLDGIGFMKILGLKSDVNAVLNLKGFKLIRNGKLDFLSFLKYCNYCLTNDISMISNYSALQEFTLNFRVYIGRLTVECEEMEKRKIEYQELIDEYTPLVNAICERAEVKDAVSSCEILNVINNYQKNEKTIVIGCANEELPLKDFTVPLVEENGFQWILGEDYSLKQNISEISRKNKNIRFSPSLSRKFSAKKLLVKNSDKCRHKKPVFDLAPLVGLSLENRRTTLGSPQMARQEIFKSRHTSGKIKPLRPMVPKLLFPTSVPLKEASKSVGGITSLFLESSKVDLSEEQFLEGIPSSSGVSSFKISPKHNKCAISSPDLDQWDKSSSGSDFSDDSPPVPGPSLPISLPKTSTNEYQQEEMCSELNDSTKLLIEKFKRYKNSLNFSD